MLHLEFRKMPDDLQTPGQPTEFAFFDKEGDRIKRGPTVSDRLTANAFVVRLLKIGELADEQATPLLQEIEVEFDGIRAATGTEPTVTLKFVASHGGQNGVFLIKSTDDKVAPTMKNSAAASTFVDKIVSQGAINTENGEDLKEQILAVFAQINGEQPGQPIELNLVHTNSGNRAIILNADGHARSRANSSKQYFLQVIASAEINNKINEATASSLRRQAEEVFDHIDESQATIKMTRTNGGSAVIIVDGDRKVTHALRTMGFVHQALNEMNYSDTTRERLLAEATTLFAAIDAEAASITPRYDFTFQPDDGYGYVKTVDGGYPVSPALLNRYQAKTLVQDMANTGDILPLEAYLLQKKIEAEFDAAAQQAQSSSSQDDPLTQLLQQLGLPADTDVVIIG